MIDPPDGDVLVHAGDFCSRGTLTELRDFVDWLRSLNGYTEKVVVAGNHELCMEPGKQNRSQAIELINHTAVYLEDDYLNIDGIKFYGSPWTPKFLNWAFMKSRGEALSEVWAQIPENTDFLITHGPPNGILDRVKSMNPLKHLGGSGTVSVGSETLRNALERIQPEYHVFGHIHEEWGTVDVDPTKCINVSVVDESHTLSYQPREIEI